MSSLGVHFAITAATARELRAADDVRALVEEIEGEWELPFETDQAWRALDLCFADDDALALVFFGGDALVEDDDHFVHLLGPAQVARAAEALAAVTERWLRARYDALADYADKSDADFAYTWSSFQGLPAFFAAVADGKMSILFTVDG